MDRAKQLHFLLSEDLGEYVFNPLRPDGLAFSDPNSDFQIEIRSKRESGSFPNGFDNLKIRAKVSREATPEQIDFVEALIEKRYLNTHGTIKKLPYVLDGEEVIDTSGRVAEGYRPTLDMLPGDLQQLVCCVDRHLRERVIRFVQLLRWQQNAFGPTEILRERSRPPEIYWKTGHKHYHLAPLPRQDPITITGDPSGGLLWGQDARQDFCSLWTDETAQEPLGHQLLREARHIRQQNSRGALLIAYSALEVGLKQHISASAPDATWLAMNVPSPPVSKILKEYLPQLHKGKPNFKNWGAIKKELETVNVFANDRNRLAHRGETLKGSLEDYLTLTENFLYAFDVFEGREWAKSRVSYHFRKALDWS